MQHIYRLIFLCWGVFIAAQQNNNPVFHDTQGNIEVNGSGQLQYTLPIALPPGIKSVAPQINLLYSSGSGNGIAGYGWSLSGLTAITRMGKTIEKDGEVGGIQLDYSDYYSFNGQRLMLKSGEYGKDGAEYVTEKFSNVKIKSVGALSGVAWKGPAYWEVTFEDGSQAWYGGVSLQNLRGQTSMEYNIVKWKDKNGNTIEYQYTSNPTLLNGVPNGEVVKIKKILWGGNETLSKSHYNEILFSYRERSVKEVSYHLGNHYFQDVILEHVTVKTKGKQFKKYVFSHVKKGDTEYEFLEKITEYNSDNEAANPVIFEYANTGHGHWTHSPHASNQGNALQGDFDGDGKMDMIKYFDAHENCLEYDNDDDIYYPYCVRSETKPAGLYLFRNILDSQPMEKVYLQGFDLGKWDFEQASTAVTLKTSSGFLSAGQGFVIHKKIPIYPTPNSNNPRYSDEVVKTNIELHYYSVGENSVTKEYVHTIPHTMYDNSQGSMSPHIPGSQMMNAGYIRTLFSGVRAMDVNADGISELVAEIRNEYCQFISDGNDGGDGSDGHHVWKQTYDNKEVSNDLAQTDRPRGVGLSIGIGGGSYTTQCSFTYNYLVIDHQGNISPINHIPTPLQSRESIFRNENKHGDFNGNGKPDFISTQNKLPWLIEFDKNSQNGKIELKSTPFFLDVNNSNVEGSLHHAKTGDFNGDGKTDLLIPVGNENWHWLIYLSTGKKFIRQDFHDFAYHRPSRYDYKAAGRHHIYDRHYLVQDINGDGKSDFIEVGVHTLRNRRPQNNYSEFIIIYHENIGGGNYIAFREKNIDGHSQNIERVGYPLNAAYAYQEYPFNYRVNGLAELQKKHAPPSNKVSMYGSSLTPLQPAVGDVYINYANHQILIFSPHSLIKYSANTMQRLSQITKIHHGGLVTEIEYKPLSNASSEFYQPEKREQYPYAEIKNAAQSYAVSQLKQHTDDGIRKQGFRYRGLTTHLHGKGILGFRKTARTSWYTDNTKNTMIWSGVETDPLQDGVPVKEWSIKSADEAFPSDLTFNNNQLLSLKITEYRKDILASGIQAMVPTKTVSKNFQTQVVTENTIDAYDGYYLPLRSTTKVNGNFSVTTTNWEYLHNPSGVGRDYFIGRPRSKQETIIAYGDSKGAKEDYEYENHQLKTKTSYNQNNTGWVKDTYTYDGFGNILQTTKSNSVDNQTITERVEYDADGRFVIKKTDNLGLITTLAYNDWGQVLRQTDPFGVETTTGYDAWGKVLQISTNIGGNTRFEYQKENNHYSRITERRADGGETITIKNKVGNTIRVFEKLLHGMAGTVIIHDELGREKLKSQPSFFSEWQLWQNQFLRHLKWNTTEYDDFSRPIKATAYTGKVVETQYSGLVTTITETNAHGRFKKQTMDALGNVASSEDLGGVIHFKYNALGQNIEAKYGNNTVTTKYDHWGRKVEFNDPSNGIYRYEYNGFGALTKTISPKGYKTYTLNDKGQLIAQNEVSNDGHSTQKNIHFEYNTKGQLTKKQGTSKGRAYQTVYTYDTYGRSASVVETHHGKTFTQDNIEYDHLSRVASYRKSIQSGNQTTAVEVQNVYGQNGTLQEMRDKNSGQTLWKLHQIDAEGKVLSATLGRANVTNSYSPQGFITNMNHSFGATTFAQVSYDFDAIKNELKSRVTGGDFNILESFEYDHQNRLVNWTDPVTGHFAQNAKRNVYDAQGRITYNDDLGAVQFANPQSVYRPSGVTLNTQGEQNLATNLIQHIQYNENNDPISINGKRGDYSFGYGLTNMRQVMGFEENFIPKPWEKRRPISYTKYYSEDGSFEIVRDNNTQQEKHIIYIGGSPYESEILYIKNFTETTGSYKFLHKDYLGSILAISDEAGNKVEQRHYDAWGNLTHLQIGSGGIQIGRLQPTAYSLLLDRGYTSHEHLFEVGLIHMNGRLYDPLLRRFLNADEHIQDPYNTQNYNKYGYVYNNPLMYNDPSGEFIFTALAAWLGSKFLAAVVIGAAIGVASYTVGLAVTGNLHQWSLGGALKSAFWGAVSGAMTFGIGNLFSVAKDGVQVATQFAKNLGELGTAFVQSGLHAVGQGVLSVMQGGSFEQAFWSGALGSLGASGFGAIAGDFASSAGGTIAFGALSGGIGAELSGGNFWEGAVIGGIVAGLNHVAHRVDNDHEWMLTKDGKTVKVGNKGGDQIDYLYDEHYGPVLDRPLLAVAEVEHSTITTGKFSSGGHSTESGFGYRIHRKFGGHALQDPSFDIMSNIPLSGGAALTKMGLTKVLKSDYGVRVVLGGSKTMLRSSYFFTNQLGLNYKMGVRLPTLYKSTNNLGQFLGRNSAFFGVVSMRYGANRYVNQRK